MKTIIYAYSEISRQTLEQNLGKPQYSYYFVLEKFLPVLSQLGEVRIIQTPDEADQPLPEVQGEPVRRVLFSFTPPHLAPVHLQCPVITVFAWEFTTLPNEAWDDNARNDWRYVFARHAAAVPLSCDTAVRVREMMGANFVVEPIPVPLFDSIQASRDLRKGEKRRCALVAETTLTALRTSIIDSDKYQCVGQSFTLIDPESQLACAPWDGSPVHLDFSLEKDTDHLFGFHGTEPWGVWSQTRTPGILLPSAIWGEIELEIEVVGYGQNADGVLNVSMGSACHTLQLSNVFVRHRFRVVCPETVQVIAFSGPSPQPVDHPDDLRRLGFGLRYVKVLPATPNHIPPVGVRVDPLASRDLRIQGLIYTTVLNPFDHRKNWKQIVSAFVHAFRDTPDATLLLKVTHHAVYRFSCEFIQLMGQLKPFSCRVISLQGFLSVEQMDALRDVTSFYVNASSCEGLCLPIMEFMSCGIPGIAPKNSAMLDYVDERSHFIVEGSPAPTIWPHDPRNLIRTTHYRIHWDSLEKAFRDSATLARENPDRYQIMSHSAMETMRHFCSDAVISAKLDQLLERVLPS